MNFEHPLRLLGLLLLVPLALLEWRALGRANRAVKLLLGQRPLPGLLLQLLPKQRVTALALRLSAVALLGLGAAGPQWGREAVRRQSQGSEVVFVVDVSASMETKDVPPSRMEEARHEAEALLGHLAGNRVGVVAFAGDAVRLCPLTLDQAAVRLTLQTIGPGTVSEPGTDLGKALRAGLKLLPAGHRDEQAMVVWTDGEDLEGHAREALSEVKSAGLRVLTVGVGTPAGDVIPISDVAGVTVDMKRDEHGEVVRSRLDEPLLRDIARATHGGYFAGSRSGGELLRLATALGSLARSRQGTRLVERPVARFPIFAMLASGALLAFLAAPKRRIVRRSAALTSARPRRAAAAARTGGSAATPQAPAVPAPPGAAAATTSSAAAAVLALLVLLPGSARGQSAWARGDAAFRKGNYVRAESLYARRARLPSPPSALLANLAAARAQHAPIDSVENQLMRLASRPDRAGVMSGYNLGTLLGRRGDVDQALAELRRTIERDPSDPDARWNYEWLRRQKDEASKSQSPKPNDSKPDDKQQPKPQDSKAGQGSQAPPDQPPPSGSQSQSPQAQAPPAPGTQQPMTRKQAEELLGSLGDLERLERKNGRQSHSPQQKRGKDW